MAVHLDLRTAELDQEMNAKDPHKFGVWIFLLQQQCTGKENTSCGEVGSWCFSTW